MTKRNRMLSALRAFLNPDPLTVEAPPTPHTEAPQERHSRPLQPPSYTRFPPAASEGKGAPEARPVAPAVLQFKSKRAIPVVPTRPTLPPGPRTPRPKMLDLPPVQWPENLFDAAYRQIDEEVEQERRLVTPLFGGFHDK